MAKNKSNGSKSDFAEIASSLISGTITVFLSALVTIFPLIYHDSYFDILETKYKCWCVIAIGMIVVVAVLALILLVIDRNEFKGVHAAKLFSALRPENWKKTFCLADAAVLLFWLSAVISTLQSDYRYEAFWGNRGRYSGLFLITIYVTFYFVVSRFWKIRNWILEMFLISGMIMCAIGITDYFQMDILHFRDAIRPEQSAIFTSTVGNINTYTAYVALVMGAAAGMFAMSKNAAQTIWYYCCMATAFFAIIMGCSDNAYLALGAMFLFLPFTLFRTRQGVLRYIVIVATFVTVIPLMAFINRIFADTVIGLDSLFGVLANIEGLWFAALGLWLAAAFLHFLWFKNGGTDSELGNGPVRMWFAVLVILFAAAAFVMYNANLAGNGERYGRIGTYLVFNDQWGTNRGYIWRKSLETFQSFPMIRKLFGYGPDTFGILSGKYFRAEMIEATGQVFDSAHNEYIQFLVTVGLAGTVSYIIFLLASCWNMKKGLERNPWVFACMVAVVCYCFQAMVNLNLPISAPMMWLLLSVGTAAAR